MPVLRVLMLSNEYPPLGGGMASVLQSVLSELAAETMLHVRLVTSCQGAERPPENLNRNCEIHYVSVPGRGKHHATNRDLTTYAIKALLKSVKLHREAPFNVTLAWSTVPAGGVAFFLKSFLGIPYITRLTGPDIPGFEKRYASLYPILKPLLRSIWRASSSIIAKCPEEASLLQETFKDGRCEIIPNACETFGGRILTAPYSNAPLKILCVSRLIERKGHKFLFEAIRELVVKGSELTLTLVGDGDYGAALRDHVKFLGISDQVVFLGYVDRLQLSALYQTHNVFVLPSLKESMSVAALEALAHGLPLVLTSGGGSDQIVKERINGFLCQPGSSRDLIQALEVFENNPELLGSFAKESLALSRGMSWRSAASGILMLLRSHSVSD